MELPVDIPVRLLKAEQAIAEMNRMGATSQTAGRKMGGMNKIMGKMGLLVGGLTSSFVALATVTQSFALAKDFETSLTRINTLVGVGQDQISAWKSEIVDLAAVSGKGLTELADAMFFITSAGQRGAAAMEALESSAKAAAIGLGDTVAIADAVTSAMNAYAKSGLGAGEATDILVATVREGKVAAEELAPALGRVIGTASSLGVSFNDLGAFIATYTKLGVPAAESVTSLRATLLALNSVTKKQEEAADRLGVSFKNVRKTIQEEGLFQGLSQLAQAVEGNAEAFFELFPNVRASAGVLGTIGTQAEEYAKVQERMRDSIGLTSEGFKVWSETAEASSKRMGANWEALKLTLGEELAPAISEIADLLTDLSGDQSVREFFKAIGQGAAKGVKAFGAAIKFVVDNFTALKHVAIAYLGLKLLTNFSQMGALSLDLAQALKAVRAGYGGLVAMEVGIHGLAGATTALGTAMKIALGPVGLLVIAFTGLMALVDRYEKHISDLHETMMNQIHAENAAAKSLSDLTFAMRDAKAGGKELAKSMVVVADEALPQLTAQVEDAQKNLKTLADEAGHWQETSRTSFGEPVKVWVPPSDAYTTASNRVEALEGRLKDLQDTMADPVFADARRRLEEFQATVKDTGDEVDPPGGGGGLTEGMAELTAAFARQIDENEALMVSLMQGEKGFEMMNRQIEIENVILAKNISLTSAEGKALLKMGLAAAGAAEAVEEVVKAQKEQAELRKAKKEIEEQTALYKELAEAFSSGDLRVGLEDMTAMREAISALKDPTVDQINKWVEMRREQRETLEALETLVKEKALKVLDDYLASLLTVHGVMVALGDPRAGIFGAMIEQIQGVRDELSGLGPDIKDGTDDGLTASEELWKNFAENVQRSFGESISEMLRGNLDSWEDFFDSIYQMFTDLLAQMVAKALTEKIVLGGLDAGGEDGAGGVSGGAFKEMKDFFKGMNKLMSQGRRKSEGGSGGLAAGGGAGGLEGALGAGMMGLGIGGLVGGFAGDSKMGSIGGAIGAMIGNAILPVVGGYIGAVLGGIVGGILGKAKTPTGFAEIAVENGLAQVGDMGGKLGKIASEMGEGVSKGINTFITALGGELVGILGSIKIDLRDKDYRVNLDGAIKNFGEDAEAAVQYAIVEALKRADISGISGTLQAALRNSTAGSIEELERDIGIAQAIDAIISGDARAKVTQAFQEIKMLVSEALRLGIDVATIAQAESIAIENMRNEILGIQDEGFADRLIAALDFNEELKVLTDSYAERRQELQAEISGIEEAMDEQRGDLGGLEQDRVGMKPREEGVTGGENLGKLRRELDLLNESALGSQGTLADVNDEIRERRREIKALAEQERARIEGMMEESNGIIVNWYEIQQLLNQVSEDEKAALKELRKEASQMRADIQSAAIDLGKFFDQLLNEFAGLGDMASQVAAIRAEADALREAAYEISLAMDGTILNFFAYEQRLDAIAAAEKRRLDELRVDAFGGLIDLMKQAGMDQEKIIEKEMELAQMKFQLDMEVVRANLIALSDNDRLSKEQRQLLRRLKRFGSDIENFRPPTESTAKEEKAEDEIQKVHVVADDTAADELQALEDAKAEAKEIREWLKDNLPKMTEDMAMALIGPITAGLHDALGEVADIMETARKSAFFRPFKDGEPTGNVPPWQLQQFVSTALVSAAAELQEAFDTLEPSQITDALNAIQMLQDEIDYFASINFDMAEASEALQEAIDALVENMTDRISNLSQLGQATNQIDAFWEYVDELETALEEMSAAGIDIGDALKDLETEIAQAVKEMELDLGGQLLGYLSESEEYQDRILELQRDQQLLDLQIIKAQLQALGVWEEWEDIWNDAVDVVKDVGEALTSSLKDALETLLEFRRGLATDVQNPLAAQQQFFAEQSNFNRLVRLARSGDEDAIRELSSVSGSLLSLGQGVLSQAGFSSLFNSITSQIDQILANNADVLEEKDPAQAVDDQTEAQRGWHDAEIEALDKVREAINDTMDPEFKVSVLEAIDRLAEENEERRNENERLSSALEQQAAMTDLKRAAS